MLVCYWVSLLYDYLTSVFYRLGFIGWMKSVRLAKCWTGNLIRHVFLLISSFKFIFKGRSWLTPSIVKCSFHIPYDIFGLDEDIFNFRLSFWWWMWIWLFSASTQPYIRFYYFNDYCEFHFSFRFWFLDLTIRFSIFSFISVRFGSD